MTWNHVMVGTQENDTNSGCTTFAFNRRRYFLSFFLSFLPKQHNVYPPTQKLAHTHAYRGGEEWWEDAVQWEWRECWEREREKREGKYYSAADGSFRDYHLYHHHHHHKEHIYWGWRRIMKDDEHILFIGSEIKEGRDERERVKRTRNKIGDPGKK